MYVDFNLSLVRWMYNATVRDGSVSMDLRRKLELSACGWVGVHVYGLPRGRHQNVDIEIDKCIMKIILLVVDL